MKLSERHIKPSHFRKPFFDGDATEPYRFNCPACGTQIEIQFSRLLQSAWGWEEHFSKQQIEEIKSHFDIGASGKSPDGGWPAINQIECSGCNRVYLSYIGFYEYRNSVYQLTEQGLSSIET
jgi:hypothetical protein